MSQDVKNIVNASNSFSLELYRYLIDAEKNMFFSPISISTALSMVYTGARETTAEEMKSTLGFNLHWRRMPIAFEALLQEFEEIGEKEPASILKIANALWLQKEFSLLENFQYILSTHYKGSLIELDFKKVEEAMEKINQWTNEKTAGKIPKIFERKEDLEGSELVITNAIYFLGNWKESFKEKDTKDLPFYLISGSEIKVPMMYQKKRFVLAERPSYQALMMDYKDQRLAMIFILPRSIGAIAEIEKTITVEKIEQIVKNTSANEVEVYIPKFTFSYSTELSKNLRKMGMVSAFTDEADFSGITDPKYFKISKVIHKAFVEVNEKGTEAAAVTAITMRVLGGPLEPPQIPVFKADHPFIFLMYDKQTEAIMFMGRVMDPSK